MTKYLITGGKGFIGRALAKKLNGEIVILSRKKPEKNTLEVKYKYITKSIDRITRTDLEGIDVIYHCASTVDNYGILENPHKDIGINLTQLVSLLEKLKHLTKKPKIVYLSTFFVYGNYYDKCKKLVNEDTPTNPLSLYSATKLCAESIIKLYGRLYQIPYVICRLTNIYGPGDKATHKKGVLNYFVNLARRNKSLKLYDGGNFIRDYVYIDDLVSALTLLEKQGKNDTFLIASGTSVKLKNVIKTICKLLESKSKVVSIKMPKFHQAVGVNSFQADASKIKSLGWRPKINYKKGLKMLTEAMMNTRVKK